MMPCDEYPSHHHNCCRNWAFMLFFQVDIHQEHAESYLQKKEKSSEHDLVLWMTHVFFKKGKSTPAWKFKKRISSVSDKTLEPILSLNGNVLITSWKWEKKLNCHSRMPHLTLWSDTGIWIFVTLELHRQHNLNRINERLESYIWLSDEVASTSKWN